MTNRYYILENTMEIIFDAIVLAGQEGISKKDLLDKVKPIDQSTVYRSTKKLESELSIRIIKNGQRTSYVALDTSRRNIVLGSYLLGRRFATSHSFLGKERLILSDHIQHYPYHVDFSSYRHFFEPKFTEESRLERTIFEFSNQLGAFMTYLFIQVMNKNTIQKLLFLKQKAKKKKEGKSNNNKQIKKQVFDRENRDGSITEQWIKNSISPGNLIQMLWKFRNSIERLGYTPDDSIKKGLERSNKFGTYFLKKKAINELSEAFRNVYPRLYYELEKLANSLPENTSKYKEFERDLRERHIRKKEDLEKIRTG
jgi:hypothetical protein